MSQSPDPYPIEPTPPAEPPAGRPRIEKPGLMEGFEEDADFTRDPELDRAVAGPVRTPAEHAAAAGAAKPDFVRPLWEWEPKLWAVVGVALLIGAMTATGINLPAGTPVIRRIVSILLTLYTILVHTGTGVVAVYVAAVLLGKRLGRFEVAAARMFAAVSAFGLMFCLNMTLTGSKFEETVVAAGVYLLIVTATFQLWKREPLTYVVGSHFTLWLIVQVGMLLATRAEVSAPA